MLSLSPQNPELRLALYHVGSVLNASASQAWSVPEKSDQLLQACNSTAFPTARLTPYGSKTQQKHETRHRTRQTCSARSCLHALVNHCINLQLATLSEKAFQVTQKTNGSPWVMQCPQRTKKNCMLTYAMPALVLPPVCACTPQCEEPSDEGPWFRIRSTNGAMLAYIDKTQQKGVQRPPYWTSYLPGQHVTARNGT